MRECLAVGANTAAAMLCRKMLFHVAVTHGLEAKNEKGWAPTFKEVVDLVKKRMLPWVDRIKDVGDEANQKIQPVSHKAAFDVATFTQQLLTLAFEMDALMEDPTEADV